MGSARAAKPVLDLDGARIEDVVLEMDVQVDRPAELLQLAEQVAVLQLQSRAQLGHRSEALADDAVLDVLAQHALSEADQADSPIGGGDPGKEIALLVRHV